MTGSFSPLCSVLPSVTSVSVLGTLEPDLTNGLSISWTEGFELDWCSGEMGSGCFERGVEIGVLVTSDLWSSVEADDIEMFGSLLLKSTSSSQVTSELLCWPLFCLSSDVTIIGGGWVEVRSSSLMVDRELVYVSEEVTISSWDLEAGAVRTKNQIKVNT